MDQTHIPFPHQQMLRLHALSAFPSYDLYLCTLRQMDPSLLMQIMAMSTMKDHERLELLKEIGGTKVYEERRKESLKILHETDNRRSRILEVVILKLPCHVTRECIALVFGAFWAAVGILCLSPRRPVWAPPAGCLHAFPENQR